MDDADLVLRNHTYRLFVELGRAPAAEELGAATGTGVDAVRAGWTRLAADHALVLHPATTELRMANPFSAVPTAYRVRSDDRWWYANCAWDAFGVCAALHSDGRIESSCPDCGEALQVDVTAGQCEDDALLFHCLVAASRWWDDIAFT